MYDAAFDKPERTQAGQMAASCEGLPVDLQQGRTEVPLDGSWPLW